VQQDLQPFPPRIKIASEGYFENGSTLGELVKTFGKDAVIQQEYDSVYIMYNREETDTEYNARVLKEQKKRIRATKQKETMEQNAKALYEQLKAKFG
jgi:hypothetical protein